MRPGITNALGCAAADLRHDYVNTVNKPLPSLDGTLVKRTLEAQIAEGHATLLRESVAIEGVKLLHFADMQFQGQSHILTVALPGTEVSREQLQKLFDSAYNCSSIIQSSRLAGCAQPSDGRTPIDSPW